MILRHHAGCRDNPRLPFPVVSMSCFAVLSCVVCVCLSATRSRASPPSSPGVGGTQFPPLARDLLF